MSGRAQRAARRPYRIRDIDPDARGPNNADRPTFQATRGHAVAAAGGGPDWGNNDLIDIPTFLRKR